MFLNIRLLAPVGPQKGYIAENSGINPIERLLTAVRYVESQNDDKALNILENAYGAYQIRPIRLRDYNKRTNNHYKMIDCLNPEISKKIFLFYFQDFGIYRMDEAIRAWNGSGRKTYEYLRKVQKVLLSQK